MGGFILTYRVKLDKALYRKLSFLEPSYHARNVLPQVSVADRRHEWPQTHILRKHTAFHTANKLLACLLERKP
jgi:hypothetical protein